MNNPPVLTITSPVDGSKIGSDKQFSVKCSATDPDGISKAELYIDSRFVDELTASPFQWTLNALPIGNHTVTILAYDNGGLTTGKTNTFSYYTVTSIQNEPILENEYPLKIFPNQVGGSFILEYNLVDLSPAEFNLYDSNGKLVQKQIKDDIQSRNGEFTLTLDNSQVSGIYYLTMQQSGIKLAACKLIKKP
jgi:hypothetical protein